MKKEFLDLGDYKILIEDGYQSVDSTVKLSEDTIGIVYYLSGEVVIAVEEDGRATHFSKRRGMMSSFFSSQENTITQSQNPNSQLKKVSIFLSREKLHELIGEDIRIKQNEDIQRILSPQDHFVQGVKGIINPFSNQSLEYLFNNQYTGTPKRLLIESQIITLLSDYLNLSSTISHKKQNPHLDKLHYAKEILLHRMDAPPTLNELAKLTAMNTYSLKTGFKELFGLPVFKFLQSKRLDKAFELLENKDMTVQEVAWFVGYRSLGSFSNAFKAKFGIRPTDLNQ